MFSRSFAPSILWILFDEQFNYVSSTSGFEQVGADTVYTTHTKRAMPVSKNGFLYIYVSNETPNIPVFFDNLQVTHVRGQILEETHYYPFGLTMAGISSKAAGGMENRYMFDQGTEFNKAFDLNIYETNFRSLDPQIGRFWQTDALATFIFSTSPYSFVKDNPIIFSDRLGLNEDSEEKSTKEKPKNLEEVAVSGKIRPKITFKDILIASFLPSTIYGSTIDSKGNDGATHVFKYLIDRMSDGMPDPIVLAPPKTHGMWKKFRVEEAKAFVRYSVESLVMFIPGLDAMVLEEEAMTLMAREGMVSKEVVGEETVYRVYGDGSKALGRYWSPVNPNSVEGYRNLAGLPNVNSGRFVIEGTVTKGDIILERAAIPLDGNKGRTYGICYRSCKCYYKTSVRR